ncbi:MAG: ABC-type transport system, involved in lipoprotein release, permease component [halophilic archaeon J07HB67]|nr:MAG: ABC-type transport system, involved in lipoprotein release, permease component [halophilic archaeon J07HB67]
MSFLYRIVGRFPSVVIARRNISRAKTRSALAALAIVIGVVAIGAIGGGSVAFKESQFALLENAGANNVFVQSGFDARAEGDETIDREELLAIQETTGADEVVGTFGSDAEFRERPGETTSVGVTYMEDPRVLYDIASGELPTSWRNSVVLDASFAADYRVQPGDRIALVVEEEIDGQTVRRTESYRVTALYDAPAQGPGTSEVILPVAEAPNDEFSQVQILANDPDAASALAERLDREFNERKDRLFILELSSIVRFFENLVNSINLFLVALGSISLIVAGVAIANTMLMAVIKRREEIGVLRAVGYQKGDVLRVLLVESAMLGAIGTFVGIVLATLATMLANSIFLDGPFAFTGEALLYLGAAAVFGVLISLIAGIYPAWRAANDRPVEALRG